VEGGWLEVRIPLLDMGGANTTITRVQLQDSTGGARPTFYIDDLRFVGSGSPSTPPPTPSTPPSSSSAFVYDDSLRWSNWSWQTIVNIGAASPVFAGSRSMAVTYNAAWAGLSFYNPGLNTSPYTHLQFAMYLGGRPPSSVSVGLSNTSGAMIKPVNPASYVSSSSGGWTQISIPLWALGATNTTITRVTLQENTGGAQATLYIDNLVFVTGGGAPPTPQPGPSGGEGVRASSNPPGGLQPSRVPQFIVVTSDDNYHIEGNTWLLDTLLGARRNPYGSGNSKTFDGAKVRGTLFVNANYEGSSPIRTSLRHAYDSGHEIANHTYRHVGNAGKEQWLDEIKRVTDWQVKPTPSGGLGISRSDLSGFRAPYLQYNPELYQALHEQGLTIDSSIQAAGVGRDGSNDNWPYTLVDGSPEAKYMFERGWTTQKPPGSHPNIWELPLNAFFVPPMLQGKYGPALYGCDWNLIEQRLVTPDEFYELLRYNLDLRLNSNRAPMVLCLHSQLYGVRASDPQEKREQAAGLQDALSRFMDYALSKSAVRAVRAVDLINWMLDPRPLN
jgi:peptidoglycan/xylan/chitin deacetylase (PgdA/CDA1 family)